jgi:excisionase family DNA binding protein
MSTAKVKFLKNCQHCKREFMAQRVDTQYCGLNCARRAHKTKLRERNMELAQAKNNLQLGKATSVITEEQIMVIQAKEYLTLKEAALLLSVSPLTLRRWIFAKKISSRKIGKKHILDRSTLLSIDFKV